MKCCKCGAELKVGSVFCEACGEAAQIVPDYNLLEDEVLTSILDEKKESSKPEQKQNQNIENTKKSRTKQSKNKTKWIVMAIIIGILLVICILLSVFTSYSHLISKGQTYDKQEAYTEAISYYEKALKRDSSKVKAYYLIGADYYNLKKYTEAEDYLLQAVEIAPNDVHAYKILLQLYMEIGDYDSIETLKTKSDSDKVQKLFHEQLITLPVFSEKGGNYSDDVELSLSNDSGHTILYTLDGTDPTDSKGIIYQGPIQLTEGETIVRAVCRNENDKFSQIVKEKYIIKYKAPAVPIVTPAEGSFTSKTSVSVTIPEGSTVYYTWDGSTPTTSSAVCSGSIKVPEGNNILSLIVVDSHGLSSNVLQCNYRYIPN